jgi:hypothetical protein
MLTKILGISGKKQAGKTSASNFLCGSEMLHIGIIRYFHISNDGRLIVNTDKKEENGETTNMFLEFQSNDIGLNDWLETNVFQHIKPYSFADSLKKDLCMGVLGLEWKQVYGDNDDKNSITKYKYPPGHIREGEYMTARQVMQFVGTDVMRAFHNDIWIENTLTKIEKEESRLAVIADVRFPNEVKAIQTAGGKVIRLTRKVEEDTDASEVALDADKYDWANFDFILENQDISLEGCHAVLHKKLIDWGYINYNFIEN